MLMREENTSVPPLPLRVFVTWKLPTRYQTSCRKQPLFILLPPFSNQQMRTRWQQGPPRARRGHWCPTRTWHSCVPQLTLNTLTNITSRLVNSTKHTLFILNVFTAHHLPTTNFPHPVFGWSGVYRLPPCHIRGLWVYGKGDIWDNIWSVRGRRVRFTPLDIIRNISAVRKHTCRCLNYRMRFHLPFYCRLEKHNVFN